MMNLTKGIAAAAIALGLPLTMGSSANAAPLMAGSALSTANTATSSGLTQVRWRGHGGWHHHHGGGWGGVGAGLAAGALIGGAIAASQAPYYYGPGYGYAPGPAYVEGDAVSYCMQRYKSYDPRSGTFLGYDGLRHPCP
jgi:hypothetical protein